jgi:hypothetical protein
MSKLRRLHVAALVTLSVAASMPVAASIELSVLGRYAIGQFSADGAVAEIPAYDPVSKRLFVVSGVQKKVEVLDASDPSSPTLIGSIDTTSFGEGFSPNSAAVGRRFPPLLAQLPKFLLDLIPNAILDAFGWQHGSVLALAIENGNKQAPGVIALYNPQTLQLLGSATVGALPDMVTFTHNGRYALVANEGEPNSYNQPNSVDPEGSVSVVDVTRPGSPTVRTAGFSSYNGQDATLRSQGVRIFGPNASVAQDMEPEYISVGDDDQTAYVALQENNAIASIDLATAKVKRIAALGTKDHNVAGSGLDPSDREISSSQGKVLIGNWPVRGLYMPDGIASYSVGGVAYVVTANEGDARDYTGFAEEKRIKDLTLDTAVFPNASDLKKDAQLGRLKVTSTLGDANSDGKYEALYSFGARSFSIFRPSGQLVFDSGDDIEQITSSSTDENGVTAKFNANHSGAGARTLDDRSDDKGPEPEGVVLGKIGDRTYAFVGLERFGGVMAYDVTDPQAPVFADFINTRDFSIAVDPAVGVGGDLGPEGLVFVPAKDSPNGKPLLIVSYEVSGTTVIFQIDELPDIDIRAEVSVGIAR